MMGTVDHVLIAAIVFVGIHILSSTPIRGALVRAIGEGPYTGAFSLLSLAIIIWLIMAYIRAPYAPLWDPAPAFRWIPLFVMPVALFLAVAGVTTRNPIIVGQEKFADDPDVATGILTITRHPLFWGFALWAVAHLLVNGDLASVYFFGCFALLALGGMPLIDRKKEAQLGAAWGPLAMRTSAIPFVAALQGRTKIDWRGIGWWRPALALLLYALVLGGHRHIFGVPPWPLS